jgi:Peptidase family M1 domain/Peptidase M1 N-terminal domain/ERAP1-like C-terminal domain
MRAIKIKACAALWAVCGAPIAGADNTQALSDGRQILPRTLVPEHYELRVIPNAEKLTFSGAVQITGNAPTGGRQIVLNAKGLTFDEVRLDGQLRGAVTLDEKLGRATLTFPSAFAPGRHTLSISYHGPITQGTLGFFAMDYHTQSAKRRTLATNLEPAEARALLPCWDEPALKASFTISVDIPVDQVALSNMPVAASTPLAGGLQRVRFAATPRMSTYLLFLGVGDFERIHQRVDDVDVGVVFKRGDAGNAAYALGEAVTLLHYYDGYFGVHFPLPKLDLIAAPGEITGSSMENWGAIFFSQDDLLFDPAASTERERQGVFLVVSHEMSHQWFGDLVTMAWWDNLWLNEGFARWMQTHAADALHPAWHTGLQAARIFESGKLADAKVSTHPVLQPVVSAEQAVQAFDEITYDKGAAVITMLEAYVGATDFRDGVRAYMHKHAFGNTVDSDLWREIQAVAHKPVLDIEHDFTRQVGVPLVRIEPSGNKSRLAASRFAEEPDTLKGAPETRWRLPLAIEEPGQAPATIILTDTAVVAGRTPLVNAGGTAYARVAYPAANAAALAERTAKLKPMDQLTLMNDAWALGQSGYAPARNLMTFIARLPADTDPIVWDRAVRLLVSVDRTYGEAPGRPAFRKEALRLLEPVARALGTVPRAGESPNAESLRSNVWSAQVRFGDVEALARAKQVFTSGEGSTADQRAALDIVGLAADQSTFDALLARAKAVQDPLERMRILRAMALATDPSLSARMVDIALGPDTPAGSSAKLLAIAGAENPDSVWHALAPQLAKGALAMDQTERWYVVPAIAAASADPTRIDDVRRYGEQDMPADARRPVDAAVASIKLNERAKADALPDIDHWIASQVR